MNRTTNSPPINSSAPSTAPAEAPAKVIDDPYLTADEAAVVLKTTKRAVYALIARGELDNVVRRLGRRVLLSRRDLVAWIESHKVSPAVPAFRGDERSFA